MTLAYDRITPIPVMHIYDTGMMLTAIAAAKDTYETAQKQLDEFTNKYSDFMSPFAKDMERYGLMVKGVLDAIDTMYANGIDPLRSAEGRMMLRRIKNSIDPGEFNRMRVNAKIGFEYLQDLEKAKAAGDFDEDYENWRLQNGGPGLFNEFSSANGAMWNTPAVGRYKDLNNWTHHLFDNMELSYDPELSKQYPGFMAYTKNRDTMNTIVSNNIAELLKTDLGKYQLAQLQAKGLDYNDAVKELQKRIVDSNWEEGLVKLEKDPYYFADYENKLAQQLARVRNNGGGGGGSRSNGAYPWSFAEVVRRNAATSIMGQQIQEYSKDTLAGVRDEMIKFGKQVSDNTGGFSFKYAGKQAYKLKYGLNRYGVQDINNFLAPQGFSVIDERTGTMLMPKEQIGRLRTEDDVISNTVGFRGRTVSSNNNWLDNADIITVTPTTGSYGALMKNKGAARFENQFEMDVVAYKNVPAVDKKGEPLYNSDGTRQMTRKVVGKKRRYLDSHITSTPSAKGTGWLGTVDAKGKINDTPKLSVTNTQDHRFQDAVQGDKAATDAIIRGTGYISDGIPSELPLYGR